MHFVMAEGFVSIDEVRLPTAVYSTLEGESLDKKIQAVSDAVYKRWSDAQPKEVAMPTSAYPVEVFDGSVIVRQGTKLFAMTYEIDADGKAVLGEPTEVKQSYVAAAKYADCEECGGTGQVKDGDKQKDCPTCEGEGKMRAAAGARHSTADMKMIQTVHDHAMALGAQCDRGNFETAAAAPPSTVRNEGGRWLVYSRDGSRVLGTHATKDEAVGQEQAIARSLARQGIVKAAGCGCQTAACGCNGGHHG